MKFGRVPTTQSTLRLFATRRESTRACKESGGRQVWGVEGQRPTGEQGGADEATLEDGDGALWGEVLKAAALVLGPPLLLGLILSFAPFTAARRTRMTEHWAMEKAVA